MAQVIITLKDDTNCTTMDVQFTPPISNQPTLCQSTALRVVKMFGGKVEASRDKVQAINWINSSADSGLMS